MNLQKFVRFLHAQPRLPASQRPDPLRSCVGRAKTKWCQLPAAPAGTSEAGHLA